MRQTTNLGLNLPEGPDNYNKDDYNDNFEIIDEKLKYLSDHIHSGTVDEVTITENGTYTAPEGAGYSPVHVNVATGTQANLVKIVDEVPSTPTEGAVYLIPNGDRVVPPFPTISGVNNKIVTCNVYYDARFLDVDDMLSATKFWLLLSINAGTTQNNQVQKITYGSGRNEVKPEYIFEYDTSGDFEWTDITADVTQADWELLSANAYAEGKIIHDIRSTIYSGLDIIRNTVGNNEYMTVQNLINSDRQIRDAFYIDKFIVYYVENGIATNQGSHTLKWVVEHYS